MLACIMHAQSQALVMELCERGDLLNYVRQRANHMIEIERKFSQQKRNRLQLANAGVQYRSAAESNSAMNFDSMISLKQLVSFAHQICLGMVRGSFL